MSAWRAARVSAQASRRVASLHNGGVTACASVCRVLSFRHTFACFTHSNSYITIFPKKKEKPKSVVYGRAEEGGPPVGVVGMAALTEDRDGEVVASPGSWASRWAPAVGYKREVA